ncbi:MAG: pentapeptide repeat-containing protein [Leptolyngbyaceae cyanobacterium]
MSDVQDVSILNTTEALCQAYRAGQRAFSGLSLSQADLRECDLKGADLSYAELSDADLTRANLRGTDLSYASLRSANLTETDLRGAMLIGTDLRQALLTGTQLHDADYDPAETLFPKGFDPAKAGMKQDRQTS